jgi:hypothetical protein
VDAAYVAYALTTPVTELTETQLISRSIDNLHYSTTEPASEDLAETRQGTIDRPINGPDPFSLSTFLRPVAVAAT